MEGYMLPDNSITSDPIIAAEEWAKAFYQAKDALLRIRPIPEKLIRQEIIRNLDEILAECDKVFDIGDR